MSDKFKIKIEHHVIVEVETSADEYNFENPTTEQIAKAEKENFLYYMGIDDYRPEEIKKNEISVQVIRKEE